MAANQPEPTPAAAPEGKQLSTMGAAFLGIGAMVGAGIFALLGEAGNVAGSAVWLSFLLAGIVSTLLGYNAVKLGMRYPSSGGILTYVSEGFGRGRILGVVTWLGYFSTVVIVCAMVAVSFGSYAVAVFVPDSTWAGWDNVFTTVIVVAMALLNVVGTKLVAQAQSLIVFLLLGVFAVCVVAMVPSIDLDYLAPSTWPSASSILASVAITFFAFLGFAVITFAAGQMADPERQLPRALYVSLAVATCTYVLIALGVFGTLTPEEANAYGETALAEAVRPTLGEAGFLLVAIAAMLATASSVNATLFAAGSVTKYAAGIGQMPPVFARTTARGAGMGMLLTMVFVIVLANLVDLSTIASVGSAISLVVFLLVGIAGLRLRAETGASLAVVVAAITATAVVLASFFLDAARNAPETLVSIAVLTTLAIVIDATWSRSRDVREQPPA